MNFFEFRYDIRVNEDSIWSTNTYIFYNRLVLNTIIVIFGIEVWVMKQWIKNNQKIDKKVVNSDRKLSLEKKPSFSKWSPDFHANGTIFKFSNFVATERKCSARVVRQHRLSRYTSTSDTSISTAFRKWSNFFWKKIFILKK